MSNFPRDLKYTKEHEWVRVAADGTATIGLTFFAQDQLGDLVYLSLPKAGTTLTQLGKAGEVESVKAVSDIYAPISGQVLEVNQGVADHPEVVNQDPYGKGWLLRLRVGNAKELANLLTVEQYEALLASGSGH